MLIVHYCIPLYRCKCSVVLSSGLGVGLEVFGLGVGLEIWNQVFIIFRIIRRI